MEGSSIVNLLQECISVKKPEQDNSKSLFNEIIANSRNFPIDFPIETVRCHFLIETFPKSILEENIASTYPLIHERVLKLMCSFLLYKRIYGTKKEKALYKEMTVVELADRLLKKRSVAFLGAGDNYLLLSKNEGVMGWDNIGTDDEESPLVLENCLSYDEMKLSAMLYVSGQTMFINDGSRYNSGKVEENSDDIEEYGIIIGLIGTRFERKNLMEYQEMIITKGQNTFQNGYGICENSSTPVDVDQFEKLLWRNLWSQFYEIQNLQFEDAVKLHEEEAQEYTMKSKYSERFVRRNDMIFDNAVYRKHLSIPFDCVLLEASRRGIKNDNTAYLHIVGIGLGVWKLFNHQTQVFVLTLIDRIKALCPKLRGLSDVHVAYISHVDKDILTNDGKFIECDNHPSGGIKVHLSKREPSSKLTGEHRNKLLVESYAWDGNAQPGNEFWFGSLCGSGDPAAACSSQVAELHNSQINTSFVCGQNLHVAGDHGILHVSQYAKLLLESPV